MERELQEAVRQKVLQMKEPDREILLRYYYYYQPVPRIAREMGMSPSNIKVRLYRARNTLRSTLTDYITG